MVIIDVVGLQCLIPLAPTEPARGLLLQLEEGVDVFGEETSRPRYRGVLRGRWPMVYLVYLQNDVPLLDRLGYFRGTPRPGDGSPHICAATHIYGFSIGARSTQGKFQFSSGFPDVPPGTGSIYSSTDTGM